MLRYTIPSNTTKVDKIKFPNEKNFDKPHKFEEMDLEVAKNKTFTVYPYTYSDRFKSDLESTVEEFKQKRLNNYNCEEVYTPQI